MSELSVRETAARAAGAVLWSVSNYPGRAQAAMLGQDTGPLRDKVTDAVLAAVADNDGLADVLAGALMQPTHAPLNQHDPETGDCVSCPWPVHALPAPDIAAHLADVVRAWLRGTT